MTKKVKVLRNKNSRVFEGKLSRDVAPSYFTLSGIILGIIMGIVFNLLAIFKNSPENFLATQFLAGFIFFLFQILLGVPLHKPQVSKNVYYGLLVIPATYSILEIISLTATTQNMILLQQSILNVMLNILIGWAIIDFFIIFYPFWMLSGIIWYLTGYDTTKLNEIERLGYVLCLQKNTDRRLFMTNLEDRLLIDSLKKNMKIIYSNQNGNLKVCFFLYNLRDDTITKFNDNEKLMDFKAEVEGLLNRWKQKGIIKSYTETSQFPEISKLYSIFGRRKIRLYSKQEIKLKIVSFPKEHPALFALTIAIISAILSAVFTRLLS